MDLNDFQPSEQTRQLWKVELEIADVLLNICNQHNLSIWAGYGTLIGAARHKGFIPWDDDLDFVMMRSDYDKLMSLIHNSCVSLPKFYEFDTADISVIKLRRSDTTMLHPRYRRSNDLNQGVWIDVFCLDYVPNDLSISLSEYERLKTSIRMYRNNRLGYYAMSPNIHYFLGHFGLKIYFTFKSRKKLRKKIENRLRSEGNQSGKEKVWCFLIWSVIKDVNQIAIHDASCFEETILLPFEDRFFQCPKEYDKLLTEQYGDWRTPVMGASQHEGSYIDLTIPYTEFVRESLNKMPWWKRYWYKH